LLPILAAGLAAYMYAPGRTYAQDLVANQPVWFTFANSVQVPGQVLPPGQYEFKQTSSKVDRQVIEIYNKTSNKPVATVMAVGTSRTDGQGVPEKPEIVFYEAPANTPPAVMSWWYPGIHTGHAFIYSKDEAMALAKVNTGTVYSEESVKVTELTSAAESAPPEPKVDRDRGNVAVEPAPVTPPPAPVATEARNTLPHTASNLPMVLTFGIVSLFAGVALFARRRTA
jgi:hypothetical protein